MSNIKKMISAFLRDEKGLTTVEYAVAGALVAAALVTSFDQLGTQVKTIIDGLKNALT